jgi:hypothetical protein
MSHVNTSAQTINEKNLQSNKQGDKKLYAEKCLNEQYRYPVYVCSTLYTIQYFEHQGAAQLSG